MLGKGKDAAKKPAAAAIPSQAPPLPSQTTTPITNQPTPMGQPSFYGGQPPPPPAAKPYPAAVPSAYPAAAPTAYPAAPGASVLPQSAPMPIVPDSGQERFRTISSRSRGSSALQNAQLIAEESESIGRGTLDQLRAQKDTLNNMEYNIRAADEDVRQGVTELKRAEQHQKSSWFGFLGGKRKSKDMPAMLPTLPTIGFNSEPVSANRMRNTRQAQLERQIDDVKEVMAKNIDRVLDRGEKIESLAYKSEALAGESQMFYKKASQLKRSYRFKKYGGGNYKYYCNHLPHG